MSSKFLNDMFRDIGHLLAAIVRSTTLNKISKNSAATIGASASLVIFDAIAYTLGILIVGMSFLQGMFVGAASVTSQSVWMAFISAGIGGALGVISSVLILVVAWVIVKGMLVGFIFRHNVNFALTVVRGILLSALDVVFVATVIMSGGLALPAVFLIKTAWYALIVPPIVRSVK